MVKKINLEMQTLQCTKFYHGKFQKIKLKVIIIIIISLRLSKIKI